MFDEKTQHYQLALPHLNNLLKHDVERLRTSLVALDDQLKLIETYAYSALNYVGDWDAATNTPGLPAASEGNKGDFYIVSVGGSTTVGGYSKWVASDWVVSVGSRWVRVCNRDEFDAAAITSGTLDQSRIPAIPTSRVTGLDTALAANIAISKVTGLQTALDANVPISKVTNLQTALDGKQPSLGFTPVQQSGGAGQSGNKIYIGWGGSGLKAQIDALDYGTLWSTYNFNPASYMPVSGGAFTGMLYTASINGAMVQGYGNASLEVRSASGTGDWGMASIGFHAQGYYGINLGLRADGYFGLGGWSSVAWRWYSTPGGDMVASGNIGAYSDPRLKDDVERIDDALSIIEQLDGVRFTWNHKTRLIGKPGQRDIGVLADQVEAVVPEVVGRSIPDEENDGECWRVVDYARLVPVLIEAVKELAGRVKLLEAR